MIRLGPFKLDERIGQGGMGEVWSAEHVQGGEPVAVKILSAEALRDVVYRSAFRNEVRAIAALRHPHIVRVYEYGEVSPAEARQSEHLLAGMSYLAMELADGGSLAPRRGRLAWAELRAVLLAMLDALAHAHARGVIHRDLKPGNILLGRDQPIIKLTDFGLAHAVERTFPWQASSTAGTPSYMAPEQFVGEWRDFGPATDLYGLGCVAWALATGHPPFRVNGREQAMQAHLGAEIPPLDAKVALPGGFEAWVRRLLEKDLKYRPASAAEAAWALRSLPDVPGGPPKLRRDRPARALPAALRTTTLAWTGALLSREDEPAALPFPADWREEPVETHQTLSGTGLGLFGLRAVPLVGREAERDILWRALRRVWTERRPVAVILRGQPGSGKSRLVRWLQERATELGVASSLRSTHGASSPGWVGLERAMTRWFRCVGLEDEEVRYRVQVALSSWGEPDPREVDAFVEIVSPWAREGEPAPDVGGHRRRGILRRFLERIATDQPVVVALEDVQWGAEALDLAHDLLRRGDEAPPVLFLLTWREDFAGHEESAGWIDAIRHDPYSVDLPVEPLDQSATGGLVQELAGLDPALGTQVAVRSEGIPLFAVQLVTDWVDREVLVPGPHGYRLAPGTSERLPDDLHQVWIERLDRILEGRDPADREALEIAAALGDEIDTLEWVEVCVECGLEAAPVYLIERMLDHQLATRSPGGDRWAFAHGMLRESLERMAAEVGRAEMHHAACAAVIERRGGRGLSERLGRHLLAAGRAEEAIDLLLQAADAAVERGDPAAADALLGEVDRAIAAAGLPGEDRRRVEEWLVRSQIETVRGEHTQAARWARIAATAAEQYGWDDQRSRALAQLGWSFHVLGHPSEAVEFLEQSVALGEGGDHDRLVADALARLGEVDRSAGRLTQATARYQRALGLWRGTGAGAARCLLGLGAIARTQGDLEAARVRLARSRALFAGLDVVRGIANAAANLSDVARQQGHYDEAVDLAREAVVLYEEHDAAHAPYARLNLALALVACERDEEAQEILRLCVVELHRQGWRALVAVARLALLRNVARHEDWESWDRHLRSATELIDNAELRDPDVPWLLELAAEAARLSGEPERAREALRRAAAQWNALGQADRAEAVVVKLDEVG